MGLAPVPAYYLTCENSQPGCLILRSAVAIIRTPVLKWDMTTLVAAWWNGKWGHLARRNIYLRTDDIAYEVSAIEDAGEGRCRYWTLPSESIALALVADLMDDDEGWRETTRLYEGARGLSLPWRPVRDQVEQQHDGAEDRGQREESGEEPHAATASTVDPL